MAIPHAASGQLIDLRQRAGDLAQAQSHALCKTNDLEVMRLVIPAHKTVPPHHVDGDLTMQCLEGVIDLVADGQPRRMAAGHMLWLAGGVEYSITAIEDALLLVTIALRR
jgi:quercetin dioxygenase-like cupin family protein